MTIKIKILLFKICNFFSFLIFIHLYINIFIDGENLTLRNIYEFGFSISLFTISYYFFDFLNKKIF